MKSHEIRQWIEAGYRDYGEDPWFFIRELAQNSRDAGAHTIHVAANQGASGEEILIFEDDGKGMSYDDAVRYLFRLYASSKNGNKDAAGRFGIGFWTVMRFKPHHLIIESCTGEKSWGIVVDDQLHTVPFAVSLKRRGTRVTLTRKAQEAALAVFEKKTREALERYCLFLRRNNRTSDPLPVIFKGHNLTEPMRLPGPVSLSFKNRDGEGAVGLGPRPSVRLYARGLPVWEGTSLDELSHNPPSETVKRSFKQDMGQGLAPVFLLNGNRLEVNISRRKVIDDHHLQDLRDKGEKALARMVEMAAEQVMPRSTLGFLVRKIKKSVAYLFGSFIRAIITLLLVIIPLEIYVISYYINSKPGGGGSSYVSLRAEDNVYNGASVRTVHTESKGVEMIYDPPDNRWFKLFHAERYVLKAGFIQEVDKSVVDDDEGRMSGRLVLDCGGRETVYVRLRINRVGQIFLPQAHGLAIDPSHILLNGKRLESSCIGLSGGVTLEVKDAGELGYRCCQWLEKLPLGASARVALLELPGNLILPIEIEEKLGETEGWELQKKVELAIGLTSRLLVYDSSGEIAGKYKEVGKNGEWLKKVLDIGAGDCDIINGVAALLLRKMGVPSRLVIGLVGKKGRIVPGLHAWTEYYDDQPGEFRVVDVTGYIEASKGVRTENREVREPDISLPIGAEQPGKEKLVIHGGVRYFLYGMLVLLPGVAIFLIILLVRQRRRKTGDYGKEERVELNRVKESLADILLHFLLHPGVWGGGSEIRNYRVIPTIDGGAVSLRDAIELGRQQRLFTLGKMQPLAQYLVQVQRSTGVPILDSDCTAFGPLIRILPGALHLERILALRLEEGRKEANVNNIANDLLGSVNQLLGKIIKGMPGLLVAPGLHGEEIFDVDISGLPDLGSWGMPRRFIAVNPFSQRFKEWMILFKDNRLLAQYRLIDMVFKQSHLIPAPVSRWREAVSIELIKGYEQI